MRKTLLFIIVSMFLFVNCNIPIDKKKYLEERVKDVNIEYEEVLANTKIPSSLMNHFPRRIESLPIKTKNSNSLLNKCIFNILYTYSIDNRRIDSLTQFLDKNSIVKYNATDTSFITIKRSIILDHEETKSDYKNIDINNNYPVPFFESEDLNDPEDVVSTSDVYSDTSKSGLSQDFTIYVLDSRPGAYWEGLKPLDYMPEGLENGFSKGVCINEKKGVIIYWVIIW